MRIDASLSFVPVGSPLSLVGAAGAAIPSTNTIDLLGPGVGVASPNIIGNVTTFGANAGVGRYKSQIQVNIGTALATATAATLTVALQVAPDDGTNNPGTWQTIAQSPAITAAQGTAGQVIYLDWPPNFPFNENPRFVRLNFEVPAATDFTAGTIACAFITPTRDEWAQKYTPRNYTVA